MEEKETHAKKAQALQELAMRLKDADSIAEDVPELRSLFHASRTSRRNARDGSYCLTLHINDDGHATAEDKVYWMQTGSYNTHSGLHLTCNPKPFMTVEQFRRQTLHQIERAAGHHNKQVALIDHRRKQDSRHRKALDVIQG